MKSLEIQALFVKKGLTVRQIFLFVIIPFFVACLKKCLFTFLVKELHLFLIFLCEIKIFLDGQLKYLFFVLDLFIIALLRSLVMKGARFPLICFCFSGGVVIKYIVKNFSKFFAWLITIPAKLPL